jgi:hypothetical protein
MRELMRRVRFTPYRKGMGPSFTLTLYYLGVDGHQPRATFGRLNIGYKLTRSQNGKSETLFEGSDYSPSPLWAPDSAASVEDLMSFLTLRPGDADEGLFSSYTERQLEWARAEAEDLEMEVLCRFKDED